MNYFIFYDKSCPICCREMNHILASNPKNNLFPLPLQENVTMMADYGINYDEAMLLMHMVDEKGTIYKGMSAFRIIYRENQWHMLATLISLPGISQFMDWFYPIFARHRNKVPAWLLPKVNAKAKCKSGRCQRNY